MRQFLYKKSQRITLSFSVVFLFLLLLCPTTEAHADSTKKYILGGYAFGAVVNTDGVYISSFTDPSDLGLQRNPAARSGLKLGDVIKGINERKISTTEDLSKALLSSNGKSLTVFIKRQGKDIQINVKPIKARDGNYRLGVNVRESVAGIGTITYICKDTGAFGGLGHGICDAYTGDVIEISKGSVRQVRINNVVKSETGRPGEIRGSLIKNELGAVLKNTQAGIFGIINSSEYESADSYEAARKDEIKCGEVKLYCSLDQNGPRGYCAVIESINKDDDAQTKNFTIRITDPTLLDTTGGIVQGMSGSPIIQNGKLIGAITHVFVDDPTRGYGIFIENMLAASK